MWHDTSRWIEVIRSQFPFEADRLVIVRELLPDAPPSRAWSNFELREGLRRPIGMVDDELGTGLVYPYGQRTGRLKADEAGEAVLPRQRGAAALGEVAAAVSAPGQFVRLDAEWLATTPEEARA